MTTHPAIRALHSVSGRTVFLIGIAIVLAGTVFGDAATEDLPQSESLGDTLLEDLGPDLFKNLTSPPEAGAVVAPPRTPVVRHDSPLPTHGQPLFRKWSDRAGEDVGRDGNQSPINDIIANMRTAQDLIAQRDRSGHAGEVQQKVVADLDALIAALIEQQCQASQSAPQNTPQQSRRSQTSTAQPKPSAGQDGQAAAQESTARTDEFPAEQVRKAEVQDTLKELWGHLPQRVREQLLESPADEFLPKYQMELEQYFRGLAEEGIRDDRRP